MDSVFYVVMAIVGFFVFMRIWVWISGRMKRGKEIPAFSGEIGQKIQRGEKLLLYFYSSSCGACKAMTPVLDEMRKEKKNVFKINLMKERKIGEIFGIMGTPATVIVDKGKIDQFFLGARSRKFLLDLSV